MPRFLHSLPLFFALSVSLQAAIVAGPESEVTRPVPDLPAFIQDHPRMTTNGRDFLAVWQEAASATSAIHAVRVAADGTPIDRTPLVIADHYTLHFAPDVVSDGNRYLVVWTAGAVWGRFVEPDGTMSEIFKISEGAPPTVFGLSLRATFNGSSYLVVWLAETFVQRIQGAVLDASGRITARLDVPNEGNSEQVRVLSANGSFYMITAPLLAGDMVITRVLEDGRLGDRFVVPAANANSWSIETGSSPSGSIIAWNALLDGVWHIRYVGFGPLGPGNVQTLPPDEVQLDAVTRKGDEVLLVYGDQNRRYVKFLGSRDEVRQIGSLPFSRVDSVAVGANGPVLLATDGDNLYLQRLANDDEFTPLVLAARHQRNPSIGAVGALRLAAWGELRQLDGKTVMVARIGANGAVLDPDGIDLEVRQTSANELRPVVAGGPDEWLVVWQSGLQILAKRVALDGRVLDAEPIVIDTQVFLPERISVAWDGSHYVLTYAVGTPTRFGFSGYIKVSKVTAQGVLETPAIDVSGTSSYFGSALAASPRTTLVVWTNSSFGSAPYGALLGPSGSVTRIAFPQNGVNTRRDAVVAWNGETFLVAVPYIDNRIRFFTVSETGTVVPAPETAAIVMTPWSYIAWLDLQRVGNRFLLTWLDNLTLRAAVINARGFVEEGPVAVATLDGFQTRFGASGTTVIYARPNDPLRQKLGRVFVRELAITADPTKRRAAGR